VLKPQVALNELKPNSIDIMCSLIIDKYINHHSQYESLSLTKLGFLYNFKIKKRFQNIANVATLPWPSVGVKPNTWKSWDLESFGTLECLELNRKGKNTSH